MSPIDDLPPLREVIKRHDLRARKSLGQNFLLDLNLTARIARAAGPLAGVTVVEVGPGPGGLTRALLTTGAKRVVAIERDERAIAALTDIVERYPGRLDVVEADETNFDEALSNLVAAGTQGLVVSSDGIFLAHRQQLIDSTIKHRLPGLFAYRLQAEAGGLMAYAARVEQLSRRAAFFVDRVLKGANPADLPIEQPTHFALAINLRTAKTLGLDLPAMLVAQADEVIE